MKKGEPFIKKEYSRLICTKAMIFSHTKKPYKKGFNCLLKPIIVIGGPSTSGKSNLAAALSYEFNGVVINADSMQVYRGLEITSGAPTFKLRSSCPHFLYGVLDPKDSCSAGMWRDLAVEQINKAHRNDCIPVVVGGTGLYLRSLINGINKIPPVLRSVRKNIRDRIKNEGPEGLHSELAAYDPESASRIASSDKQRIARALEIYFSTGKKLSDWLTSIQTVEQKYIFFTITILPERQLLYRYCDQRFLTMVENGIIEEVASLIARRLSYCLPAMKALGVKQISAYLQGDIPLDEAISLSQLATRQYVKRQFTWFRNQIVTDMIIKEKYSEKIREEIFSDVRKFLLTNSI